MFIWVDVTPAGFELPGNIDFYNHFTALWFLNFEFGMPQIPEGCHDYSRIEFDKVETPKG